MDLFLLELTSGIVFFVDQNLSGRIIPEAIARASNRPCHKHKDFFPIDAEDIDWLPSVGRWGWILITRDWGILQKPTERDALLASGVRAFVFRERNIKGEVIAAILTTAMPRILRAVRSYRAPFVFSLEIDGTIDAISNLVKIE